MSVDYPDWQTPQAHADRIAATGAPLIHNAAGVANANVTIAAGASTVIGPVAVNNICIELFVSAENHTVNSCFLEARLDWTDAATGLLLARRSYKIISGASGNPHTVKIFGPVHADQVTVRFTNDPTSAGSIDLIAQVIGTSRLYTRDGFRSILVHAGGFTLAGALPEYDCLLNANPNIGGLSGQAYALPCYAGRVYVWAHTASAGNDLRLQITDASGLVLPNTLVAFQDRSNGAGDIDDFFTLPSYQCSLSLLNDNAAAKVVGCTVTIEESAN
jgi:hypothetical protein